MIISYSNNFVVLRPPKTGSTSLVFYFFKSGLVAQQDLYSVDTQLEGKLGSFLPHKPKYLYPYHITFEELYNKKLVVSDMPCVSTIRNPIERVSSHYYYKKSIGAASSKYGPNLYWDYNKTGFPPQSSYFPPHAELFNTENLHEHVSKYILERGGKVDGRIEMRKNPDNKLDVFLAELTPDRKQDILDTYAKDFELWEKAYAVYN